MKHCCIVATLTFYIKKRATNINVGPKNNYLYSCNWKYPNETCTSRQIITREFAFFIYARICEFCTKNAG